MTLRANKQYAEGCNDIWGYKSPEGVEYAILGTRAATAILDLSDPDNPVEVAYIPGSFSTWRDMKNWGHYIYVTCDAGNDGLLIINMEDVSNITWQFWKPELTVGSTTAQLLRCHNLYIDENGYMYLSGCNPLNNGGVLIFDVHSTPGNPFLVGRVEPVYSHDNYTRGDTVYSANLTQGVYITDVTDKSNIITLATVPTSRNFAHNVWPSDDGNYMFTTDEVSNGFVDAYDISNTGNVIRIDQFQPEDTKGTGVIPHNTHYFQGYNVVSWYTDGVKVIDSHKPDNLIEVANYDTYLGNQVGFQGCWGAYPFLPSGLLLASDINTCLWVFDIDYVRASYLEGIVIDGITKLPIQGAEIIIQGGQPNREISDGAGNFKTGSNQSGTLTAVTTHPAYFVNTSQFDMVAGQVTDVTIELLPRETTSLTGIVREKATGLPIPNAGVYFEMTNDPSIIYLTYTNEIGFYKFDSIYLGNYRALAGAWGFQYQEADVVVLASSNQQFELTEGYRDDFIFNKGWQVTGTTEVGKWDRGVPELTLLGQVPSNPGADIDGDYGDECYVTGLTAGNGAGANDVDDGETRLTSPVANLADYKDPMIRYHYWFFNGGGNGNPNDTLKVYILTATDTILAREYTYAPPSAWRYDSIRLADYIAEWTDVRFQFVASDQVGSGHVVEGGVDGFEITEEFINSTTNQSEVPFCLLTSPNPFEEETTVTLTAEMTDALNYQVYDIQGRLIATGVMNQSLRLGQGWMPGTYFLTIFPTGKSPQTIKLHKTGR